MTLELFFRIAFFVVFFSFAWVMTAFTQKAKTRQESLKTRYELHNEHEVPLLLRLRQIFGLPFYVGVLIWTFAPTWMAWASLPFPQGLRWAGVGLGVFSIFLNGWSHKTLSQRLGRDFDPALRLIEVPALVQDGPYKQVRHPIYLAFLFMQIAVLLITANGVIGFCGLAIIISVMMLRIPEEERLLVEQFGDEYRSYSQRTGRVFPLLSK